MEHPFLGGPVVAVAPGFLAWRWFGPVVGVVAWVLIAFALTIAIWAVTRSSPDAD